MMRATMLRLCGLALLLAPLASHAAEFIPEGPALRIVGAIEPGDDAKFAAAWGERGYSELRINAPGGDTQAALAIGEVIARKQPLVVIDGPCLSQCANYLFLASPQRRVVRDGLVCFRGAPARNETELRAHVVMEELKFSAIAEDQVEPVVKARLPAEKALAPRVDMLLRIGGVSPQILHETDKLLIPYEFGDDPYQPHKEFLAGKQGYWCPTPEAFARYGVVGHWDWFPVSDRAVYQYGQRLSETWIFASRLAGKGDRER